jgi:hypothetical protein
MRTIISLGTAALLTLAAIVTWATATTQSSNHIKGSVAVGSSINPFDLMKNSKDLPHQQYDAY